MGSPLAPLLANLFMGFHEKNWIEHYQGSPPFAISSICFIFAAFNSESEAKSFLIILTLGHRT